MHQSFETPASPHSGLSGAFTFCPSESEWSLQSPGTTVSGAFPRPYCSTHTCGTPFVKQLTNRAHGLKDAVGSYEVKTFLSGHQISCKGSSMPKDCQNVFMVEVVSLILGWKNWQWNKTDNWYSSVNRTNKSRIETVSTDSVNSFWWLYTMWSHYTRIDSTDQSAQNPSTIHVH